MRGRFPVLACGLAALLAILATSSHSAAWSNGGYSADPSNPDYGTHDWIAQHALDWLPVGERQYLSANLAAYLYGTELPDNGGAPDGIGDATMHHVYYRSGGALQDDASAVRASEEFAVARAYLQASNYAMAAKVAGIMSHYIADVAVFGHVMGSATDWGAEVHHSDYETYVTDRMTGYASGAFDPYLSFDGVLGSVSAYDAALRIARNTTFGDGGDAKDCVWMDANYDWGNPTFKDSAGASLNRAVNALADVLHTLAVQAGNLPPVDTGKPMVSITSPAEGETLTSAIVTVTGYAADDVGVQRVDVSKDATHWEACGGTTSWAGTLTLAAGSNTIYARAIDIGGNWNVTSVHVTVSVPPANPGGTSSGFPFDLALLAALVGTLAAGLGLWERRRRRHPGRYG